MVNHGEGGNGGGGDGGGWGESWDGSESLLNRNAVQTMLSVGTDGSFGYFPFLGPTGSELSICLLWLN